MRASHRLLGCPADVDQSDRVRAGAISAAADSAARGEQAPGCIRRTGALESVLSGDLDRRLSRDVSCALRGPLSLQDYPERDVSLTTTLFFGVRLEQNTRIYFDPEIAGGKGFSGVDGIANPPNGEIPRVASATPKPYLARLFIQHDFGFGSEKEHVESDENQLAGERPRDALLDLRRPLHRHRLFRQ